MTNNIFEQNRVFLQGMAFVHDLEQNAPVSNWKYKRLHVWPIFKYVLVKQLIISMQREFASSDYLNNYQNYAEKKKASTFEVSLFKPFFKSPAWQSEQLLSTKVLFMGNSSNYTQYTGAAINHHHDHFRLELEKHGIKSASFVQNADKIAGGLDATLLGNNYEFDSFVKFITQTAMLPTGFVEKFCGRHFPQLAEFSSITGIPAASLTAYTNTLLGRTALSVKHLRWLFKKMCLDAVFSDNYASFFGWATACACRELNIPFIDLQHGFQGRLNGSYHWYGTPKFDWSVLPSHQFCYTSSDKQLFESAHSARKSFVLGPSWFQYDQLMSNGVYAFPEFQREQLAYRDIRRQSGKLFKKLKRPIVLFAAQHAEDIVTVASLAKSFCGTILYRNHPTNKSMGLELVSDKAVKKLHLDYATQVPLPILLSNVDLLVTGYSAILLEAVDYGIPCIASNVFVDLLKEDYGANFLELVQVENGMSSAISAAVRKKIERSTNVKFGRDYLTAAEALRELHLIN